MTKISNQRAYIPDTDISNEDYYIGTDADNSLKTVNFKIGEVGSHYNMTNGLRNFDYVFYQHQGVSPTPTDGYFYSNDNIQVLEDITYFIFPKKTAKGKDSSLFFDSMVSENPFDLTIAQKIDNNTVFFFTINSIETFPNYYKLNVSKVFFPIGKALEYVLSYAIFTLKTEGVSIHNNLSGLNEGDYLHLTATEKAVFDNQSGVNTGDQDLSGLEPAFSKNTAFNKNFGAIADTVVEGNDSRMSDARPPLPHTHPQSNVDGLVTDLGNKLDKDISTLTAVSLPLLDTDKLIINRGGVDYSVDKSELGGGSSNEVVEYTFVVTSASTFSASTNWFAIRKDVANSIFNPLWAALGYDGITGVTDTRIGRRNVMYDQQVTEIALSYSVVTVDTTIRFVYYEINPSGTSITGLNNHIIHEITIPANTGSRASIVQETLFIVPATFTMLKGGMISMVINNGNVALSFKDFIADIKVKKV